MSRRKTINEVTPTTFLNTFFLVCANKRLTLVKYCEGPGERTIHKHNDVKRDYRRIGTAGDSFFKCKLIYFFISCTMQSGTSPQSRAINTGSAASTIDLRNGNGTLNRLAEAGLLP
jgi:hypothetical protein